jgi:carbamoyl-phosphate synthase large subunit
MEHIEEAGIHSGDSACAIPPYSLPGPVVKEIRAATVAMARELNVVGLMNVQYAVRWEEEVEEARVPSSEARESDGNSQFAPRNSRPVIYVIEVNPRASRTVPFVAKATGMPVARIAAKVMVGVSLAEQGITEDPVPSHVSVKESVLPFIKFAGVDIVLGPEMRSTGEVMGISPRFSMAFAKSQLAAGTVLPMQGNVFLSVADRGKPQVVEIGRRLHDMGYSLLATEGTAKILAAEGIPSREVKKIREGHPNLLDFLANGEVALVMNTPRGKGARTDEGKIRAATVQAGVPCLTTIEAATAAIAAMEALREEEMEVEALQDRFAPVVR